jgi:hypothetical protein
MRSHSAVLDYGQGPRPSCLKRVKTKLKCLDFNVITIAVLLAAIIEH